MLEIAFQYSYEKKGWVQCTNTDYIEKDIEKLPVVVLVEYSGYGEVGFNGLKVYCQKHRKEEEVCSITDGKVISDEGCIFEGLLSIQKCRRISQYRDYIPHLIPYRWRIFQNDTLKSINVAADVLDVSLLAARRKYIWYNFAFSINIIKRKSIISKIGDSNKCNKEWTEIEDVEVPDVVVDKAINVIGDSIKNVYGIKPSVLSQIKGKNKLKAYIKRPFDLNIVFLEHFFKEYLCENKEDYFDFIFPYEEKDNYKIICKMLNIKPHKSLRRAYAYNPYAIVWYMIFKQWNVKDINYMHRFFYLDDCIACMYLHKFYYNTVEQKVTRNPYDALDRWKALEFYCQWLMVNKGEKRMLNWLYDYSSQKELTQIQWDIIMPFCAYYEELSDEVKNRFLRDGLTKYVHDAISAEVVALNEKWCQRKIKYNEKVLAYECRINDYEFRLIHNTGMLTKLGAVFNNCVPTYRDRVIRHESVIMYVVKEGCYKACIEIQHENHIVQALGKYNHKLNAEINRICYYWALHHDLMVDDEILRPLSEIELAEYNKTNVEDIPYIKSIDEMSLDELLALDDSRIKEGYYLLLGKKLSKAHKKQLSAPGWMKFADEKSYLSYVVPLGQRIYDAAFSGNAEAMRALGFMYYKGTIVKREYDKALQWFIKAADSGSKEAAIEAKRLNRLTNGPRADRDVTILEALSDLRRRMSLEKQE